MALDHLGVIGSRLRSTVLKQRQTSDGDDPLLTLDEVIGKSDFNQLERLIAAHDDVSSHLAKRSSEDQAYDVSRTLVSTVRLLTPFTCRVHASSQLLFGAKSWPGLSADAIQSCRKMPRISTKSAVTILNFANLPSL